VDVTVRDKATSYLSAVHGGLQFGQPGYGSLVLRLGGDCELRVYTYPRCSTVLRVRYDNSVTLRLFEVPAFFGQRILAIILLY
jgi:hypothetical protein